jgi:hypothetical protein
MISRVLKGQGELVNAIAGPRRQLEAYIRVRQAMGKKVPDLFAA